MTLKYQTFDSLFEALARSEFRSKFRLTGDDRVFAELRSRSFSISMRMRF